MEILPRVIQQQERIERRVRKLGTGVDSNPWRNADETWTYASATTFTIADPAAGLGPGDYTTTYQPGDFIRLKQGGAFLYACITAVAYADPTTTVTVSGDVIADATITDNYYSKSWSPQGAGGIIVNAAAPSPTRTGMLWLDTS